MRHNKKAFTLVEMLVALAVSSIIIAATFASFELIQKQYKKNIDVAELHTSGRAIMTILEREIRMAGYEFRDDKGLMTYGKIMDPLVITDSGNKCCDEVTIIYDEVFDTLNASGVVTSSTVERIQTRFWVESYSTNKHGSRHRLYKRRTILGTNNALLGTPRVGAKEIMADYIDDLQFFNIKNAGFTFVASQGKGLIYVFEPSEQKRGADIIVSNLKGKVCGLAFDPEGFLFAGSCDGGGIYKIDISTGVQTNINSSIDIVNALAYNKNNKKLYVGLKNQNIGIVDPNSGATIDQIVTPIRSRGGAYVAQAESLGFDNKGNLYIGDRSHYNYVIVDPITKKPIGKLELSSMASGALAIAGDPDGYMYGGGTSSNKLTAVKNGNVVTDPKILPTLMSWGVGVSNIQAAAIGQVQSGKKSLLTINLTIRTKNEYGKTNRIFLKKDYHLGNFNFNKNDQYFRDTFSSTVSVRNL